MKLTELLAFAVKNHASDLHLSSEMPPMIRVDGEMQRINLPPLGGEEVKKLLYDVMNDAQQKNFEQALECDFSFTVPNIARFRVNVFYQTRGIASVLRTIPSKVLSMEELNLPKSFVEICKKKRGLVLVTGATGSGKSTSLAAMVDYINETRHEHILTIEDPVEFVHESKNCLINQREVHRDTKGFAVALRAALREDPDIILVGEMRDPETIALALTAAETGHLVFGTLHTSSAATTINRIIDVFPGSEQAMVRSMLSNSLQAVIAQALLKREGGGRVPALEVMLCNGAIRNLIREDKVAQMYSVIQTGQAEGMWTMDQHLKELLRQNIISFEMAKEHVISKESLTRK
jgi:twitching motility protein PilT